MNRYLFLLIIGLVPYVLSAQNITQGEYFFNIDPGFGKATSISVNDNSTLAQLELNLNIPPTLSDGFNTVYFRFQDTNGQWSFVYPRIFYKKSVEKTDSPILAMEYFIDNDPGLGLGTAVPITTIAKEITIDFNANLSGLTTGFHQFYIRAKNADESWSLVNSRLFYVKNKEQTNLCNIINLKYYFQNDNFKSDTITVTFESPQPSVTLDFKADISSLPPDEVYEMSILATNEDGIESYIEKRTIKACSTEPPTAGFGFIGFGNTISFIDSSLFAVDYYWDFGDGSTDSVSNPVHQYDQFGTFEVSMIASSFCKNDTVTKSVSIAGLTGLSTATGGNFGDVSLEVYGGGFQPNALIYLAQGNHIIQPDTTIISGSNIAYLRFNLRDQPLGEYDVVLLQNNVQDVLSQSFTIIEQEETAKFNLEIAGRSTIRAGRKSPLSFAYTNNTPVDAIAVPLFIIIKGDTTVNLGFDFDFIEPDENDGINYGEILPYFTTDSLYGEAQQAIILPLVIPFIPAGQIDELTIFLEANEDIEVEAWMGDNFYNSPLSTNAEDCMVGLLDEAIDRLIDIIFPDNSTPLENCFSSGIDNVFAVAKKLHREGIPNNKKQILSITYNLFKVIFDCKDALPIPPQFRIVLDAIEIAFECLGPEIFEDEEFNACNSCLKTFWEATSPIVNKTIEVVNSFDPNEKTGPTNSTIENYTTGRSPFNYKVFFENVDSATADAQEVIIIDTIDTEVLEITTATLGTIKFGADFIIQPPSGLREYSDVVDLRPMVNIIVRVDAQIDTTTGMANWHFISLDPMTMELTDDPFLGFLPPNKNSPEGEGFVSFNIHPKQGLITGTIIENKASITFDVNEPIITNTHLNTIDKIIPSSSVLSLEMIQSDTIFTVSWDGMDADAGIRAFDIYVSINNKPYEVWLFDTETNQANFVGKRDSIYSFYSIAKDFAGNIEANKTVGEASTLITNLSEISGLKEDKVNIFPNPSNCCFTISFKSDNFFEYDFIISDALGRKVLQFNVPKNNYFLDLSELPKGIYFLTVITDDGLTSKPLLLKE